MANNNELNNLKAIHKIQVGGEIQNLLLQLKSGKSVVEKLNKSVQESKARNVEAQRQKEARAAEQEQAKVQVSAAKKENLTPNKQENRNSERTNTRRNDGDFKKRTFDRNQDGSDYRRRSFDRNSTDNRNTGYRNNNYRGNNNSSYDRNNNSGGYRNNNNQNSNYRGNNQNSNYRGNNQNSNYRGNNNNPNYRGNNQNSNYRANNQNSNYRVNNNNPNYRGNNQNSNYRGNNQNPNYRGNNNSGQKVGFVSSKGNTRKVFEPMESSRVLAQPERNFGNKSKDSKRTYDNRNRNQRQKTPVSKRGGVFITDNFEEVRMGSRKLIKNAKKKDVYIAPKIEHAVITTENVTVKVLSEKIGKTAAEIVKQLMILGIMATINSSIDFATAELVANELDITLEHKPEQTAEQTLDAFVTDKEEEKENLENRPPVVTVMGHVDHGKTSLLDIIRKESVAEGEAGGITQRIGAYQATANGKKITFLDTPGHAAFTSMRARGAKITDIAILVVAADDGIMPQTIEAINHIKAAETPMIVALNKMDKQEANPERIKQQLSEHGILPEEWGGDTVVVPVSAKTGIGIDKLLNMILLVADMEELKANPKKLAVGAVVEASLDKSRGPVATVLVQNGTLNVGDTIISGITYGKVKAMYDEGGKKIKSAGPATPVSVLGFNEVPQSGDQVYAVEEKLSKQVIQERKNKIKDEKARSTSGVSLDTFMDRVNEGKLKTLNIIVKADVQGSVEALKQSLEAVSNDEVRVVCIHSGAGPVTESDLVLAQASGSIVINFNLKLENKIDALADNMGVEVKNYKVIYEVVDEIGAAASGMRAKVYEKVVVGHADVRVVFKLSSVGIVAGSYVTDGKVIRNAGVRVMRDDEQIAETTVEALKIQKDDKAEVNYGYECGIKLKDFTQLKEGDKLEIYEKVEVKRD